MKHLGLLNAELPPLDVLLSRLPPIYARELRRVIANHRPDGKQTVVNQPPVAGPARPKNQHPANEIPDSGIAEPPQ